MSSNLNESSIILGYIYVSLSSIESFKINTFMKQPVAELVDDIEDAHQIYASRRPWIYKVNV